MATTGVLGIYHRTNEYYTIARMQGLVIDFSRGRICKSCKAK